MLLTFIILGGDNDAADRHHLPFKARELFVGLKPIQIADGSMSCSDMKIKVFADIDDPFADDLAELSTRTLISETFI